MTAVRVASRPRWASQQGSGLTGMASLASFPTMMQRDRNLEGPREFRAAWLVGVTVREYREMEARGPVAQSRRYERIAELYGWPQTFALRFEAWPKRPLRVDPTWT